MRPGGRWKWVMVAGCLSGLRVLVVPHNFFLRIATAHSPSHQDVRDSNPRTVSVMPYLQIGVGCWSYQRNLAALM